MISFGMQSGEFDRFAQYNETGVKKQQLKHASSVHYPSLYTGWRAGLIWQGSSTAGSVHVYKEIVRKNVLNQNLTDRQTPSLHMNRSFFSKRGNP